MRRLFAIACLMAALSFGSGQALAFQETPEPPPADLPQAGQASPDALALQLGTPNAAPSAPGADKADGGLNLFGYTVLPKLNFGLDVLYGQDEQQLQLGGKDDIDMLDENGDVSVLGKVKRRF